MTFKSVNDVHIKLESDRRNTDSFFTYIHEVFSLLFLLFAILGIKPRGMCMPGKDSITELHPPSLVEI